MKFICLKRVRSGSIIINPGEIIECDVRFNTTYSYKIIHKDRYFWILKTELLPLVEYRKNKIKEILK